MGETVVFFSIGDSDEGNLCDETTGTELFLVVGATLDVVVFEEDNLIKLEGSLVGETSLVGNKLDVAVCEKENPVEDEMEDDIKFAVGV